MRFLFAPRTLAAILSLKTMTWQGPFQCHSNSRFHTPRLGAKSHDIHQVTKMGEFRQILTGIQQEALKLEAEESLKKIVTSSIQGRAHGNLQLCVP
ncbi:hypothetical protein BKA81DRAFT_371341 [Phyllosticta paracitricarpa]